MVSKEEFNKVFKDTSREGILNQFYYEHIELGKMIDNFNELEKYIKESYKYNSKCLSTIFEARAFEDNKILEKLQELNGSDKDA